MKNKKNKWIHFLGRRIDTRYIKSYVVKKTNTYPEKDKYPWSVVIHLSKKEFTKTNRVIILYALTKENADLQVEPLDRIFKPEQLNKAT